jgi:hypothetical protein
VRIVPEHKRAIREIPTPRDTRDIGRFIGVHFYRYFIPRLDVAAALNALHKKSVKSVWGKEQNDACEALKPAISLSPVLRIADFSKTFILQTDASSVALCAMLSQKNDGVRQATAYDSRTLSAQKRKVSSTYELERLAVVFGTEFRKYIEHQEFIVETDNQALTLLLSHPRQSGED